MREVHWKLLQAITGALIFFLVGAHLVQLHLAGGEPRTWAEVSGRAASVGWVVFYIAILAVAFYHAIYGLKVIISELSVSLPRLRILSWVLSVMGICIFAYAAYVALFDILT
jgi:succinate dehydrogenase hydrophobic anchor subunit